MTMGHWDSNQISAGHQYHTLHAAFAVQNERVIEMLSSVKRRRQLGDGKYKSVYDTNHMAITF